MTPDKLSLKELSEQYKAEADKIREQIKRQKSVLHRLPEYSVHRIEIGRNIAILQDMLRDTMIIANGLEHYYDTEVKNSFKALHTCEEELNNE